ncbi:hypothetical protein CL1_0681 [Thermococcus cleftensis]|uniref:Uncharacterized protein n=1 Tax=Thermococcus cleftensis (strain DSM 27260 / KACC 17922 / CL1) TaxID=163003 RepID=I3ZT52_THECF|nr:MULTISPECIES: hypothetical protein [Thermococcus]AFL94886.1 hypothetical protein CL1_0681 [Thermococcus cleftensis]NJE03689.1 hypothetical protein [Thermococcus sp. MV11]
MSESANPVYEALGSYIDGLCGSIYLGTARGKAVFYGEMVHPLTPTEEPLPFMNIFYSKGTVEVISVWGRVDKGSFTVKMVPSDMSYDRLSGTIELVFHPEGGGSIVVTLHGNTKLARTLKSAARACKGEEARNRVSR